MSERLLKFKCENSKFLKKPDHYFKLPSRGFFFSFFMDQEIFWYGSWKLPFEIFVLQVRFGLGLISSVRESK